MTKAELLELIDGWYDLDELVISSPGGKALRVNGIDEDLSHKLGKIILTTEDIITEDGTVDRFAVTKRDTPLIKGKVKKELTAQARREWVEKEKAKMDEQMQRIKKEARKGKRPVGRPRIHPKPDPDAPKRPVGRPRKNPPTSE